MHLDMMQKAYPKVFDSSLKDTAASCLQPKTSVVRYLSRRELLSHFISLQHFSAVKKLYENC